MSSLVRRVISTAKTPAAIGPYRYRTAVGAEKDSRRLGSRPRCEDTGRVGLGFGAWASPSQSCCGPRGSLCPLGLNHSRQRTERLNTNCVTKLPVVFKVGKKM